MPTDILRKQADKAIAERKQARGDDRALLLVLTVGLVTSRARLADTATVAVSDLDQPRLWDKLYVWQLLRVRTL
jgi:hypothetical protein